VVVGKDSAEEGAERIAVLCWKLYWKVRAMRGRKHQVKGMLVETGCSKIKDSFTDKNTFLYVSDRPIIYLLAVLYSEWYLQ
jgi:hypothetical protein